MNPEINGSQPHSFWLERMSDDADMRSKAELWNQKNAWNFVGCLMCTVLIIVRLCADLIFFSSLDFCFVLSSSFVFACVFSCASIRSFAFWKKTHVIQ